MKLRNRLLLLGFISFFRIGVFAQSTDLINFRNSFINDYHNDNQLFINIFDHLNADSLSRRILQASLQLDDFRLNHDTLNQIAAGEKLGHLFWYIDQKQQAFTYFNDALQLAENKLKSESYFELLTKTIYVSTYLMHDDYTLSSLKKQLIIAEKTNNKPLIMNIFNGIIRIYLAKGSIDKAGIYYHSLQEFMGKNPDYKLTIKDQLDSWKYIHLSSTIQSPDFFSDNLYAEITQSGSATDMLAFSIYHFDTDGNTGFEIKALERLINRFSSPQDEMAFCALNELISAYYKNTDPGKSFEFSLNSIRSFEISNEKISQKTQEVLRLLQSANFANKIIDDHKSRVAGGIGTEIFIGILLFSLLSLFVFLLAKLKKFGVQSTIEKANAEILFKNLTTNIQQSAIELDVLVHEREQEIQSELIEYSKLDTELKEALKKAEEANYLKNSFLSNMSHEIRTPLNGILNYSNLLEVELAIIDKPELYEYANSIEKSGEKLLHLLNNIIDISRLEANDLELKIEPCDIISVVDSVINNLQLKAKEKGLNIIRDFSEIPFVMADISTISRVFSELIDNAIRYTEKGFIKLSIKKIPKVNLIEINILDTGIGIDKSYLPQIFEAFRHDSIGYTRQYQGTGLGLPLAQRMTVRMGGEFIVESEKTVGTTISIRLNISEINKTAPEQRKIEVPVWERKSLKDLRILLVEDDKSNMLVISKLIDAETTVAKAFDGDEAIKLVVQNMNDDVVFDLMLFDINLPAPWDGVKLMQYIKNKYSQYQNIPFIAQTAYAMIGDRERFIDAGFNEYLSKPIKKVDLVNAIHKVIK